MDNKAGAWWSAHKPTRRRLIQVYAALLYNANLKGFLNGNIYVGSAKNVCVPGLNCYSCPGAVGACPLGALQNALASSGTRAPYYIFGILLLFGLTLGRTICGWLCPFGLLQELLHKLPTPKLRKSAYTRVLSYLKYVILAIFAAAIPLVYSARRFPVPSFCKYICPAGTLEGAAALLSNPLNADMFSMLNILFTRKFIIMVLVLTACVFVFRAFCRFICPLGAIYGLFSRLALVGVKVEQADCTHCGSCVACCPMDVRRVGDHECINCGACVEVCPTSAIAFRCGKAVLIQKTVASQANRVKLKKKRSILAWTFALFVLAGTLWYFNRPEEQPKPESQSYVQTRQSVEQIPDVQVPDADKSKPSAERQEQLETPAPKAKPGKAAKEEVTELFTHEPIENITVGSDVGMRCPEFTVSLYEPAGGTFMFAPGKVTVINFWATYCTPCIAELPFFQQLYDTYGEQIDIVAVHSDLITDDVQGFLDTQSFTLPFGQDETGSVMQSLGGSTLLPMTVVVDKAGVIVYSKEGSVTYPLLESLVQPLLQP